MLGAQIGYAIGACVFSLLLPVLTLMVAKVVPAMKREPKFVYSVCVVEVLAVCYLAASGGGTWVPSSVGAAMALFFLWRFGYRRDAKAGSL